jgi:hypothetical protein
MGNCGLDEKMKPEIKHRVNGFLFHPAVNDWEIGDSLYKPDASGPPSPIHT